MKPRSRQVFVLLLVLLLAATGLGTASAHDTPTPAAQHPTQFTDVHSGSFYAAAVDWMVQNEVTTGTSPTTFHPERNVTRVEAAAFVWRMSCRPEPAAEHSFSDVHASWQEQPVNWLQQHGAAPVQGTDDPTGRFGSATPLTRAQMAGMLYQLFGDDTQPETVSPFVDVTEPWQTVPVAWLLANQITTGTSPTTFHPDRNVTRGEFATVLWRHSQQPDPSQRICQPAPTIDPEPVDVDNTAERPPMLLPEVSAGDIHTCATRADASVVCWGDNTFGQADPPEGTFQAVDAGAIHTCAITTEGAVACWGDNSQGQADPPDGAFLAVSAGWGHSCAVAGDGAIACWGDDIYGRTDAPAGTYTAVSAGAAHTCAITAEGAIACWGWNHYGQTDAPAGVFEAVAAGAFHTCAITTERAIACWGWNHYGQADAPTGVFQAVTVGWDHSCAIDTKHSVSCWGVDDKGQASPPAGAFRAISAGWEHTCAIRVDGTIACWGADDTGQRDPPPDASP